MSFIVTILINFITQKQVTGPIVNHELLASLAGAVVCIPNADPGFDWLFAYPIVGLITAWGGANSHMAIRCAEFNIPAAIGCGEQIFQRIVNSSVVELNTVNNTIKSIS